jgi:hypothetical protein
MTEQITVIKQCESGRCAYGTDCTCDYYADWREPCTEPIRIRPWLGIPAKHFRTGHRAGRVDTCRRLWPHLDDDGRRVAEVIANEGDADD